MIADVLDLFAGPGGWSVALQRLGLTEVGVEWDQDVCTTARRAGHQRHHGDVRWFDVRPGSFRGLIASPPCQTFSTAGLGDGRDAVEHLVAATKVLALTGCTSEQALRTVAGSVVDDAPLGFTWDAPVTYDARSALVLEPLRFALTLRPEWVALEQVPAVLPVWDAVARVLRVYGYDVVTGVLSAEAYGVPQTRRRAVLIASRTHAVALPRPTHSRYYPTAPGRLDPVMLPWVTMAGALGWDVGRGRWLGRFNDQSGTPYDPMWPAKRPATTIAGRGIVTNPGENANRFNGSSKSRNDGVRVTVAEAGVLQSFAPDYPWSGSDGSQFQQVGDAVPPPLAEAIVRAAADDLVCTNCGDDLTVQGEPFCLDCLESTT